LGKLRTSDYGTTKQSLALSVRFVIWRVNAFVASINDSLDEQAFGESGAQILEFSVGRAPDWDLEISKTQLLNTYA